MKYVSTRGNTQPADFVSASLMGLAPDGGLFTPEAFPQIERPNATATRAPLPMSVQPSGVGSARLRKVRRGGTIIAVSIIPTEPPTAPKTDGLSVP